MSYIDRRVHLTLFFVKYIFYLLIFSKNWNWLLFETLIRFNLLTLEMCGFNRFNQILLSLFSPQTFQMSYWAIQASFPHAPPTYPGYIYAPSSYLGSPPSFSRSSLVPLSYQSYLDLPPNYSSFSYAQLHYLSYLHVLTTSQTYSVILSSYKQYSTFLLNSPCYSTFLSCSPLVCAQLPSYVPSSITSLLIQNLH